MTINHDTPAGRAMLDLMRTLWADACTAVQTAGSLTYCTLPDFTFDLDPEMSPVLRAHYVSAASETITEWPGEAIAAPMVETIYDLAKHLGIDDVVSLLTRWSAHPAAMG